MPNTTIENMEPILQEKIAELVQEAVASAKREMYRAEESDFLTPEEAVTLVGNQSLRDIRLGSQFYSAIREEYSSKWAVSATFIAGKIYGIRQERARRKASGIPTSPVEGRAAL